MDFKINELRIRRRGETDQFCPLFSKRSESDATILPCNLGPVPGTAIPCFPSNPTLKPDSIIVDLPNCQLQKRTRGGGGGGQNPERKELLALVNLGGGALKMLQQDLYGWEIAVDITSFLVKSIPQSQEESNRELFIGLCDLDGVPLVEKLISFDRNSASTSTTNSRTKFVSSKNTTVTSKTVIRRGNLPVVRKTPPKFCLCLYVQGMLPPVQPPILTIERVKFTLFTREPAGLEMLHFMFLLRHIAAATRPAAADDDKEEEGRVEARGAKGSSSLRDRIHDTIDAKRKESRNAVAVLTTLAHLQQDIQHYILEFLFLSFVSLPEIYDKQYLERAKHSLQKVSEEEEANMYRSTPSLTKRRFLRSSGGDSRSWWYNNNSDKITESSTECGGGLMDDDQKDRPYDESRVFGTENDPHTLLGGYAKYNM